MNNRDRLKNSKTFCMAPWVHQHAYADGRVYPCCVADYDHPLGSLRENTMLEVWNNEKYRELRCNMLSETPSSVCQKCYDQERNGIYSMRQSINQSHGKYVDEVAQTAVDGTHPEFKIRYWDVRFSNLCNFSCRSCGPAFSSNWYKEHVKMFGGKPMLDGRELATVEYAGRDKYDILEQMEAHIPYIDQVYFAGGEPLLMDEHYKILERLIELGKTDINIQYNTNFSELRYKNKDVIELWKHFSNVSVGASLDASGARAEIIRHGTEWDKIVANRERMMREVPHVDFYISATVSVMNVLHILNFHREWVELGLIRPEDFHVNVLYSPAWYRIDIIPDEHKQSTVIPAYEKHLEWLRPLDTVTRATLGFEGALSQLRNEDHSASLPAFRRQVEQLDQHRNQDFWATFPELEFLKEDNSLCMLPWVGLETSPVGTARPCCLAENEITDSAGRKMHVRDHDLKDIFNSEYMQNLRRQFRRGEKPETCKKCWVEEAAGRRSKRINTQIKFKEEMASVPFDRDVVDDLWFLDLKLGNICNLKCRICGSWSSSKWAAEELDYIKQAGAGRADVKQHTAYQMLREGAWPRESEQFWTSLEELLPAVRYFEFTGGEPFLIAEHIELLRQAVSRGLAGQIELHYNTNGTVYSEDLAVLWRSFKRVEIAFSIDNVGRRFEYERYGAEWNAVNNNIRLYEVLAENNANVDLQLCFTVNVLNVLYLDELLDWAKTVKFNNYHWNMLHGPEELSIAALPDSVKTQIVEILESKFAESSFYSDIQNVIAMMRNGKSQESTSLLHRLQRTDLYRKQHLSQTHLELARILGYGN